MRKVNARRVCDWCRHPLSDANRKFCSAECLKEQLEVTRLDSLWEIYPTHDEAIEAMRAC